jgi:hypothetical protein
MLNMEISSIMTESLDSAETFSSFDYRNKSVYELERQSYD